VSIILSPQPGTTTLRMNSTLEHRGRARGRPRSLRAEQAILNATLQLLAECGYAGLTMDRVAALAKTSKATIYRRWPGKEMLVLAAFTQMPMLEPPDHGDIMTELEGLYAQHQKAMRSPLLRSALPMLIAGCVSNPALASAMEAFNAQRRVPLRLVFERAMRRGELSANTDVELAIDAIQGMQTVRGFLLPSSGDARWPRRLFRFVLKGLGHVAAD
jgi:AcrR family transcriptional regulator